MEPARLKSSPGYSNPAWRLLLESQEGEGATPTPSYTPTFQNEYSIVYSAARVSTATADESGRRGDTVGKVRIPRRNPKLYSATRIFRHYAWKSKETTPKPEGLFSPFAKPGLASFHSLAARQCERVTHATQNS